MRNQILLYSTRQIIVGITIGIIMLVLLACNHTPLNYQVQVQESDTGNPIPGAEVQIQVGGIAPKDATTDRNGIAIIFIDESQVGTPGKLIVRANSYQTWEQNLTLERQQLPDTVQLESIKPTPTPEPTSTPTPEATPTPFSEIIITEPQNGAVVGESFTVEGSYQNMPDDAAIWVLVYVPTAGRYYPHDVPAYSRSDGTWSSPVNLGNDDEFEIVAALADAEAQEDFQKYHAEAIQTQSWSGFLPAELPSGLVIPDRSGDNSARIAVTKAPPTPATEPTSTLEEGGTDVPISEGQAVIIDVPQSGASIGESSTVQGRFSPAEIPEGHVIWIVVYDPIGGLYYPHGEPATMDSNAGDWASPVFLGTGSLDIIAVVANPSAQQFFRDTIQEWSANDSYPGLLSLPDGAEEADRVENVSR
jgi:hypothetical protein